jgi:hypothetical protein
VSLKYWIPSENAGTDFGLGVTAVMLEIPGAMRINALIGKIAQYLILHRHLSKKM